MSQISLCLPVTWTLSLDLGITCIIQDGFISKSKLQILNYICENIFSRYDDIDRFWVDMYLKATIQLTVALWRSVRTTVFKMWGPLPGETEEKRKGRMPHSWRWPLAVKVPWFVLNHSLRVLMGTSLMVVQWIRHCTPSAGGPGSIPGQGTRCHVLHTTKCLRAATKTWYCQINWKKNFFWKRILMGFDYLERSIKREERHFCSLLGSLLQEEYRRH